MGDPVYSPDDPRLPADRRNLDRKTGEPLERLVDSGRELEAIREALADPGGLDSART